MTSPHQCFFDVLRLRPTLIRASRVLPSTPLLFHNVERHFFEGQLGGFLSPVFICARRRSQSNPNTPQKVYRVNHLHRGETGGERARKMRSPISAF
jgi:hypothetical protein